MSRIYTNDALSSLPVETIEFPGPWSLPASDTAKKGGVLIEGTIVNRSRHVIIDISKQKTRYLVLYVNVRRAHRRVYEPSGRETEPNFSETEKVRTGYLHSSYKTVAKGKTDSLSFAELVELIKCDARLMASTEKNNRKTPGCVALWIEESKLDGVDFANDDEVRAKTGSDGPFIESVAKLDAVSKVTCNMAGDERVGASWTDKVFTVKAGQEADSRSGRGNDNEGAADEEWGD